MLVVFKALGPSSLCDQLRCLAASNVIAGKVRQVKKCDFKPLIGVCRATRKISRYSHMSWQLPTDDSCAKESCGQSRCGKL